MNIRNQLIKTIMKSRRVVQKKSCSGILIGRHISRSEMRVVPGLCEHAHEAEQYALPTHGIRVGVARG